MSRVIVGLLVALVACLSRIFKWQVAEKDAQELIEIIVGIAGLVIAWWGRKVSSGEKINWFGLYKAPVFLVLLLVGCASPEDLTAVKATAEKLPVILEANEKVYRDTIEALTKELRARAAAEVAQAADYELLKLSPVTIDAEGNMTTPLVDPIKVTAILKTRDELNAKATAAIDQMYKAAMDHPVHSDLRLVASLLHDYVLLRATIQEQTYELYSKASSLGGK